jgi:hypothetical protein
VTTAKHMNMISDAFISKDINPLLIKIINKLLIKISIVLLYFEMTTINAVCSSMSSGGQAASHSMSISFTIQCPKLFLT